MSDAYKVELNLTHKEYGRVELVAHLGVAYGFFGGESTDDVIKRIFLSGLIGAEYAVLGGSDHGSSVPCRERYWDFSRRIWRIPRPN